MRAFILIGLGLAASGCGLLCSEHDSATCGQAPADEITGFRVVVSTGNDSTDMDIYFCFLRDGAGSPECMLLDHAWVDDFEDGKTDTFDFSVDPPIAPGELDSFWLDVEDAVFFDDSWKITGLTVYGLLADGTPVMLYDEPGIDCHNIIDENSSYVPAACAY